MVRLNCCVLRLAVSTVWTSAVYAVNSSPRVVRLKQVDGTPVSLRLRRKEFHHWYEDTDGYLVISCVARDGTSREYVYASPVAQGETPQAPNRLVGKELPPPGLERNVVPVRPQVRELELLEPRVNALDEEDHKSAGQRFRELTRKLSDRAARGDRIAVENLVVLMRFKDHKGSNRPLPSVSDFNWIFNANGGHPDHVRGDVKSGNVKDFYLEKSYRKFDLHSTVVDWVDMDHTDGDLEP